MSIGFQGRTICKISIRNLRLRLKVLEDAYAASRPTMLGAGEQDL